MSGCSRGEWDSRKGVGVRFWGGRGRGGADEEVRLRVAGGRSRVWGVGGRRRADGMGWDRSGWLAGGLA